MRKTMILAASAATLLALQASPALAGNCRDPWITQAIKEVTGREPNGSYETGECTYTQYNRGTWRSYPELKGYVQSRLGSSRPALAPGFDQFGSNFAPTNTVRVTRNQVQQTTVANGKQYFQYNNRWYQLVGNDGASMIGNDVGGVVPTNTGNFISTNGSTIQIAPGQAQQWRTAPGGKQQFMYNGKWYNILSNANGALIGNDSGG